MCGSEYLGLLSRKTVDIGNSKFSSQGSGWNLFHFCSSTFLHLIPIQTPQNHGIICRKISLTSWICVFFGLEVFPCSSTVWPMTARCGDGFLKFPLAFWCIFAAFAVHWGRDKTGKYCDCDSAMQSIISWLTTEMTKSPKLLSKQHSGPEEQLLSTT